MLFPSPAPRACLLVPLVGLAATTVALAEPGKKFHLSDDTDDILATHCYNCHDDEDQKGDIQLDNLSELDLDKRLSAASGGAPATTSGDSSGQVIKGSTGSVSLGGGSEIPGESGAYQSAYSLVRGQKFDQAVDAFNQFLRNYPDGKYAPNAHYWLGELYLVVQPPDLESSRQSFVLLLDEYPDNSKAPDAMYKLGKVYYLKGNREKAREYMDRVIRDYGSSNSSAVKLAQDFVAENY